MTGTEYRGLQGDNIIRVKTIFELTNLDVLPHIPHPDYVTERSNSVTYVQHTYAETGNIIQSTFRLPELKTRDGKIIDLTGLTFSDMSGNKLGYVYMGLSNKGSLVENVKFANDLIHKSHIDDGMNGLVELSREQMWQRSAHFRDNGNWLSSEI